MAGWRKCKPWNGVRPDRGECRRCGREKCLKRERSREYQRNFAVGRFQER